jgi:DNA repair exonuclease SbcCD ATPase subunit
MFKCAHISDVHFRSLKRHDEYKQVFTDLFSKLKEIELDCIFIGGDIVHSKTQGITPELIDVLTWWFNGLASIAPTHVILGNHDGLILNEDRQDAISPILTAINNPDIYLYKKSGVYPTGVNGFNWCVLSCFDEKGWEDVYPVEDEINIACFHGAVLGSTTDVGWELDGEVGLSFFEDYDFGFLGDIHKTQYLDEEKRICYPGSTVQQNYGEDIKKGFVYWEINSKNDFKSSFIQVENPYPFLTIDWKGSVEDTIDFARPVKKGVRYRIRSNYGLSQAEIKVLHYYLKNDKEAHEIVYQVLNSSKDKIKESKTIQQNTQIDIRDKSTRFKILNDCFENLDESTIEGLDDLFAKNLDKIPNTLSDNVGQKWSINSLKFNNTFSYGKDNFINFDKLSGVIGVFGNNRAGKSSIPGTLMYTLFNSTDRGSLKNHDVVNIRKGSCNAEAVITIGTEQYLVSRESSKKTNNKNITSATTKLNLTSLNNNVDESEEQRRETEKILRNLIGTSEDFLYTSFASQGEMNTFIKEKTSARKNVLSKFLNLDIYDMLSKESKDDYIVLKNKVKNLSEKSWDDLIQNNIKEISQIKSNLRLLEEKSEELRKKEVDINIQLDRISKNTKKHPSGYTKTSAESELIYYISKLEKLGNEKTDLENKLESNKEALGKFTLFKEKYPIDSLNNDKEKLNVLNKKLQTLKSHKKVINVSARNAKDQLRILDQVPCGDEYPTCKFIKNAHSSKGEIEDINKQLKEVEGSIFEYQSLIENLIHEGIEEKIKKYNDILAKEYRYQVDQKSLIAKIEASEEKINANVENIKKFKALSAELEDFNSEDLIIKEKEIKTELKENSENISNNKHELFKNQKIIFVLEEEIVSLEKEKEEYSKLNKEYKLHDLFSLAVSKKGIPTMLINSCLPLINKEISDILSGVTNFKIEIDEDEKGNNLDVFIDYGDSRRVIECASGMEKMMASIAIRVALINISSLPKSDVFIIDEGFGALDSSNIEACGRLLSSLKKYFKSIMIISHIDGIKDIVDKNIEISIKGKDSHVRFE